MLQHNKQFFGKNVMLKHNLRGAVIEFVVLVDQTECRPVHRRYIQNSGIGMRLTKFFLNWLLFITIIIPGSRLFATEVGLKDGRVLHGRLGEVSGLAEIPQPPNPEGEGPLQLILLVDDDISRTFVSKRLVKSVNQDQTGQSDEKYLLKQRVMHNGQIIRSVGPAVSVQPFDEYGRRTFTMYTVRGNVPIIQGITELTPRWTKVEGISHVWDMRMATSAIPRDVLHKIILKETNPKDIESFKKITRFYLQAERYEDARLAIDELLKAFPDRKDLQEQLEPSIRAIKQLSAQQLANELKLRREAGQHELVWNAASQFPSDQVGGEILEGVREILQDYQTKSDRRTKTIQKFDELITKISDKYQLEQLKKIRDELAGELSFNTIDRMAAFLQNVDDPQSPAQGKLALAVSGWLLGSDAAIEQLPTSLSMYDVRRQLREYLTQSGKLKREQILDRLTSQEGSSPALIVDLLSHMKPPMDPPAPISADRPGYFKLEVPGASKDSTVTYWVQLPPEYDPYKLYPTIVTLNGAGNTAENQLDWWAGEWVKPRQKADKKDADSDAAVEEEKLPVEKQAVDKKFADNKSSDKKAAGKSAPIIFSRNGQAARQGYIVIAPQWMEGQQNKYYYSAREHAAVLNSLRDAFRRFSIDSDRVYLTGFSIGGDAAWDIGLAHPDLWAGVIPVSASADRYCSFYWENAKYVPFYVVLGELDGARLTKNALDLDRYLKRGFDTTVVEYEGRGHDDFHEEVLRMFNWMSRFRRDFFPKEFTCSTMRQWDSFFWWLELDGMPSKSVVDPDDWPPTRGARAMQVSGTIVNNNINVRTGSSQVSIWISPKMVDFKQRVLIQVNGQRVNPKEQFLQADLHTILDDVRTRGDRQHPFWTRIDSSTGRVKK